jgi:hypothetical protein
MSELDEYLYGTVPEPVAAIDPASYRNWKGNNKKLIGFLKAYVEDSEVSFLETDNAKKAWDSLVNRHEKQGPITQVHLIQEVLSILYAKDVSVWSSTTDRICDLCDRIFAQAVPTKDVLFMVAMLSALEREADHIRSEMTSYYISNKTADSKALSECVEQEIVYKTRRENGSDVALAMQTGGRRNQKPSTKVCTNPICPNPNGHLGNDCWEKGGAMEGKRDEVLARRAKA